MPFIVRNASSVTAFHLFDQYLDLILAPSEHVDLEQVFPEDSLYMSSVSPNILYTAIQNSDIVRRDDSDTADIPAVNAFDDAIWRWSPTRQQKEALVGTPVSPSSINKYLTRGVLSVKANVGGTARYGDLVFIGGSNVSITDDGAGNFTFAASGTTPYGTPVTQTPDQTNAEGTATSAARSDHIHNIPADAPTTTLSPATSNAEGTGSSFARNDHTHAIATALTAVITTIQPDAVAAQGTQDSFARGDHTHAIVADAPTTSLSATTTNAEGTSTSFSRADHTHAITTGAPSTQTPDQTNAAGTSANLARADHIHNIPADIAVSVGSTNAEGTSTSFSRADHVHSIIAKVKSGIVASGSFTGNPKKATVTFSSAFSTTNYAVTITGIDARSWTYESKATTGFTINANANANLTGEVSWDAIENGS